MKLVSDNFLWLTENADFKKAQIIIVPFGFEETTCYGKGTAQGPRAIINASQHVELFDEELWQDTSKKVNIATLAETKTTTINRVKVIISKLLEEKKFPIILGGEHGITPFIVEAYKKSGFDNFSILQFDAHADLRDGYLGKKYSHAAAMRRCLDFEDLNLVQVGIRSIADEDDELNFWEKNQTRIKTFWAKDKKKWKISEILKSLKENVYLTFDVDSLDSSIMPSVGTPYPGGLEWYETLDILRAVCKNKRIIGADFVELAPIRNFHAPDFLVAKLIYKFIGYQFINKIKRYQN